MTKIRCMFTKACTLGTCHSKRRCLWTNYEIDTVHESRRNWLYPVFPPIKPNHIK